MRIHLRAALGLCSVLLGLGACEEPKIAGSKGVVRVGRHNCASLGDGNVRCWGGGEELPYVTNWAGGADPEQLYAIAPVHIAPGVTDFDTDDAMCVVTRDGDVWCFGNNLSAGEEVRTPYRPSITSVGEPFVHVRTGQGRTCGITEAGRAWCWGENSAGELGLGDIGDVGDDETPQSVGPLPIEADVKSVAFAWRETCVLTTAGVVRCWPAGTGAADGTTVDLPSSAEQITAGTEHFCARLEDGRVYCWGQVAGGRLGLGLGSVSGPCSTCDDGPQCCIGDDESVASAGPVALGGRATDIDAGTGVTCAVLEAGGVRCWGRSTYGVVGLAEVQVVGKHETPDAVPTLDLGGPAQQVSVGSSEACAWMTDESIRCWGWTDWWDGFDDHVCWIETEIPSDGSHGIFPTIEREFSCELHPRCCIGDDESPKDGPLVPL
ncbi:MAG: RCC1 domain-containing protein [Nannocystales bacterium]